MLKDIYAPSDFAYSDMDPSVRVEDKLTVIAASPVEVVSEMEEEFSLSLPFVRGGEFSLLLWKNCRSGELPFMLAWSIDVGDKELYGYGIGSRLLRAAVRYGIETEPELTRFTTGWARLGMVNTAIKVFGADNVAIEQGGKCYGWQSDKPLDEVFNDYPPEENKPYLVYGIDARINYDKAIQWELPTPR